MKPRTAKRKATTAGVSLDAQGYFLRHGQRVMPVGVNYWPASCGVEMWKAWPDKEMQHDLDVMQDLGLNCIRFFLRWPDFEPVLGKYNAVMFNRLARFLGWCAKRGILTHPSLVVGFMSGAHFWPKGKEQRNLYSDPLMLKHSAAFCRKAAAAIAPFHETVLALDLGNELGCADAWPAPPAAIRTWCATVTAAIRKAYPNCLIVSGTDSAVVFTDYGWRLGGQPGTDFYSVHTYPVPDWNVVSFDGMTDPLCQAILPFCTLMARAFGPVIVQEFNTILVHGRSQTESYLKAVLPACLANGANGFLWWCLRDIYADVHPYVKQGLERRLGIVDSNDKPKPGTEWVLEFLRSAHNHVPAGSPAPEVVLYFPQEYYSRDNEHNPGNNPTSQFRRMLAAYYMLRKLGRTVGIARGDQPLDPSIKTLIITGAALTSTEAAALVSWVQHGGRLIWTGPMWQTWEDNCDKLIGAQPVNIRLAKAVTVECFGSQWVLANHPSGGRASAQPTTAKVLAMSDDGEPAVMVNSLGDGKVLSVLPVPEETILSLTADLAARDRWADWYAGMLKEVQA